MSYSIYLIRFSDGDPVAMDERRFEELIAPHVVRHNSALGLFELCTGDGDCADVYARPASESELMGITVARAPGVAFLDLVARLALQLDATIVLPEGDALIMHAEQRTRLPADLSASVVVIEPTGAAILSVISGA